MAGAWAGGLHASCNCPTSAWGQQRGQEAQAGSWESRDHSQAVQAWQGLGLARLACHLHWEHLWGHLCHLLLGSLRFRGSSLRAPGTSALGDLDSVKSVPGGNPRTPAGPGSEVGMYFELNCAHPNSFVEAVMTNVTVSGDRAFKEVIKVK